MSSSVDSQTIRALQETVDLQKSIIDKLRTQVESEKSTYIQRIELLETQNQRIRLEQQKQHSETIESLQQTNKQQQKQHSETIQRLEQKLREIEQKYKQLQERKIKEASSSASAKTSSAAAKTSSASAASAAASAKTSSSSSAAAAASAASASAASTETETGERESRESVESLTQKIAELSDSDYMTYIIINSKLIVDIYITKIIKKLLIITLTPHNITLFNDYINSGTLSIKRYRILKLASILCGDSSSDVDITLQVADDPEWLNIFYDIFPKTDDAELDRIESGTYSSLIAEIRRKRDILTSRNILVSRDILTPLAQSIHTKIGEVKLSTLGQKYNLSTYRGYSDMLDIIKNELRTSRFFSGDSSELEKLELQRQLEAKESEFQRQLTEKESEKQVLQRQLTEKESEKEGIQRQLAAKESEFQIQLAAKESEFQRQSTEKESEKQRLESQIESKNIELDNLKDQNVRNSKKMEQLTRKCSGLESDIKTKMEEHRRLQSSNELLSKQIADMERQHTRSSEEHKQLTLEKDLLTQRIAEMERNHKISQERSSANLAELVRSHSSSQIELKQQIDELKKLNSTQIDTINQLGKEINELKQQLAEITRKHELEIATLKQNLVLTTQRCTSSEEITRSLEQKFTDIYSLPDESVFDFQLDARIRSYPKIKIYKGDRSKTYIYLNDQTFRQEYVNDILYFIFIALRKILLHDSILIHSTKNEFNKLLTKINESSFASNIIEFGSCVCILDFGSHENNKLKMIIILQYIYDAIIICMLSKYHHKFILNSELLQLISKFIILIHRQQCEDISESSLIEDSTTCQYLESASLDDIIIEYNTQYVQIEDGCLILRDITDIFDTSSSADASSATSSSAAASAAIASPAK